MQNEAFALKVWDSKKCKEEKTFLNIKWFKSPKYCIYLMCEDVIRYLSNKWTNIFFLCLLLIFIYTYTLHPLHLRIWVSINNTCIVHHKQWRGCCLLKGVLILVMHLVATALCKHRTHVSCSSPLIRPDWKNWPHSLFFRCRPVERCAVGLRN